MKVGRRSGAALAAGLLLAAGWVIGAGGGASAQRSVHAAQPTGKGTITFRRDAAQRGHGVGAMTLGELSELDGSYHGVAPCRLVDTRNTLGGALAANSDRDFFGIGKLTEQGATLDDCGLPPTATALVLNVTAASPRGSGNLRVWAAGGPMPTVSLVNYRQGVSIANATTVQICRDPAYGLCPEFDFTVHAANSATDVVVDVMGYYEGPLMAKVNDDGTPYATAFSVESISWLASGAYEVVFDRDVTSCTASAVIESQGSGLVLGGQVTVSPRDGEPNGIFVATFDYSGVWTDMPFSLVVHC